MTNTTTAKPTCQELIAFLDDYITGDLSPLHAEGFAWHLARCPSCTAYLASYRTTIRAAQHATAVDIEDIPPDVLTAVLATITHRK
jgi:anti-sigma factor RsiW